MGILDKLRCKKEEELEIDPDEVSVHGESNGSQGVYQLVRVSPSKSLGLLWRRNPAKKTRMLPATNWPRENDIIDGQPELHNDTQWIHVYRVQQAGKEWEEAPEGAYLPMKNDDVFELRWMEKSLEPRFIVQETKEEQ